MKTFNIIGSVLLVLGLGLFFGCGGGGSSGSNGDNTSSSSISSSSTESESLTHDSMTTTIKNSDGVSVVVPQGAVPKGRDGSNQSLVVSLEKKAPPKDVAMPDGYSILGDSWFVGPENFIFSQAIQVGLPFVPKAEKNYQLFHYNGENDVWEPLAMLGDEVSHISNSSSSSSESGSISSSSSSSIVVGLASCVYNDSLGGNCIAEYPIEKCTADNLLLDETPQTNEHGCVELGFTEENKFDWPEDGVTYDYYYLLEDIVYASKLSRIGSMSDSFNWTTTHSGGIFATGSRNRESLATNPKKTGVVTFKNYYTSAPKRYSDYCIIKDKTSLKYPDQHIADYGVDGPGIVGDGDGVASFADLQLPQGTYVFQVGRTKGDTADREHRADCDGWFETEPIEVTGEGEIYYGQVGGRQVVSDAIVNINDNRSWNDGCTPCKSTFPVPSALYGVGNIGITLTWNKKVDFDLHLTTPLGEEIFYENNTSKAQDIELDLDRKCANINSGDLTENIYSIAGKAIPSGTYRVYVKLYSACNLPADTCYDFNVRTVVNGDVNTFSNKICTVGKKLEIDNWVFE